MGTESGSPPLPALAFGIRPAEPDDYAAFERLVPELAVDDPTPDRDRFVREIMPTTLIADLGAPPRAGGVAGYAFFQIMKDVAYVRHLVTAPEARRTGVGRALLGSVAERARRAGCSSWCLNVKPNNAPAIALYRGVGMSPVFASRALKLAWSVVEAAPETNDARLVAREFAPSEDDEVEQAMGLVSGQLAISRSMQGRVLIGLFEGRHVLGATVFDPGFPGAYPFRAARPELAFTLLRALRPRARPSDEVVHVVVEGQPEVADALVRAGAEVKVDIVRMQGPVPAE